MAIPLQNGSFQIEFNSNGGGTIFGEGVISISGNYWSFTDLWLTNNANLKVNEKIKAGILCLIGCNYLLRT